LWISLPPGETLPLLEAAGLTDEDGPVPELPEMTPQEQVVADYSAAGFSLKAHPVSFLRESLIQLKVASAEELPMLTPDRRVRVAGLILMRQRPATASGITFVTLEDETGISNLVIYPSVWQKFRQVARFASVLLAAGRLQREGDVIHIVCDRMDDLSEMLQRLSPKSRDFR
jgi:error-prone DNA polymerase